jgi:iron complex transport system substrate-binding protein
MNKRLLTLLLLMLLSLPRLLPATAQETTDANFPVTIEHKFGTTTITEVPQRVVAIGFSDQDPLLALGVMPVAVRYWYGDTSNAIFPWAQDEAAGAEAVVLDMPFGNLNYEAILALQPDLISAVYSGITQEEYELLSQIAPTIAQSAEYTDFGMPWQETTRLIGAALGKSEEAEALIADVEAEIHAAREGNPQFEGRSIAVVYSYSAGTYGYYTAQDPRARFFSDLGFVVPDELVEIAGDSYYADLSPERIDLLDRDLIVFVGLQFVEGGREEIVSDSLTSQLDAVREGRVVYVADSVDDALQFSTVLSLPYALEGVLPELEAIFGSSAAANACETGFRLFAEVCVPENPQRIVTITDSDLDAVLALGVEPVGITKGRGQLTAPRYLNGVLPENVSVVGDFFSPNLELVLELAPDIILAAGLEDPALLVQLNAIAPTVDTNVNGYDWQSHFRSVADALNMQAQADEFLATYDERIDELQTSLADHLGEEFIVVRWSAEGPQVMAPITFVSAVLFDLGLIYPEDIPELQSGHAHSAPLSLETMGVIDVDWAFIGTLQGEGDAVTALDAAMENPLFQALEVVQNEQMILIDGSLWTSSGGPLAAMLVLDDVDAAMAEGE